MYPASSAFHEAVANRKPQKALLIFQDCVFTNDDISVQNGINFRDYFNLEEDISIGQTPSNEIDFTLFNDDRLLNDYAFGDFLATIGVLTREDNYSQRGICTVMVGNDTYVTQSRNPYISKNGLPLGTQPSEQIRSMLAYDGKLYCFGAHETTCIVYNLSDGSVSNTAVNAFMKRKAFLYWQGKGMHYHDVTENGITVHKLEIWHTGTKQTYEFVPLGWFTADRPKAPDKIQIDMTCNDFMLKFDEDWSMNKPAVSYPVSVQNLYIALCNNVLGNDRYKLPSPFINGDAMIGKEPDDFSTATKRDVLKWIAETSGTNAVVDRDGYMKLAWLQSTEQTYDANGYEDFEPCWYETKTVTKLFNRNSQNGTDITKGTGDEGYLILDNPILRGVS